jgi:hypothetical protein
MYLWVLIMADLKKTNAIYRGVKSYRETGTGTRDTGKTGNQGLGSGSDCKKTKNRGTQFQFQFLAPGKNRETGTGCIYIFFNIYIYIYIIYIYIYIYIPFANASVPMQETWRLGKKLASLLSVFD